MPCWSAIPVAEAKILHISKYLMIDVDYVVESDDAGVGDVVV